MVRGQSTWNLQIVSVLFWATIEETLRGESLDLDSAWVTWYLGASMNYKMSSWSPHTHCYKQQTACITTALNFGEIVQLIK